MEFIYDPGSESFRPDEYWPTLTLPERKFSLSPVEAEREYHSAYQKSCQFKLGTPEEFLWTEYAYCLCSYLVEGSHETYETAAWFAKEFGFDTVVDIGCACGVQGNLFHQVGVRYLGIEMCKTMSFPEKEGLSYLHAKYPCPLPELKGKVLGVSNLCVGYLCDAYQEIAAQFDNFLLCSCRDGYNGLSQFYESQTRIIDRANPNDKWVWFQNPKGR